MKKIELETTVKRLMADIYTPVGIYLRLRDRFRDTILLESTDHQAAENSWSFLGVNAIAGIEVNASGAETKLPNSKPEKFSLSTEQRLPDALWRFMQSFEIEKAAHPAALFAQGLYGYFTFDATQRFEKIAFKKEPDAVNAIPMARYRLYQYVIALNHFKDELFICENKVAGLPSESDVIESLLKSKDVPVYPFQKVAGEIANITEAAYIEAVKQGIKSCYRGDVFQIVLGRRFHQAFI